MNDTRTERQAHVGELIAASEPLGNQRVIIEFVQGALDTDIVTGVPLAVDDEWIKIRTDDADVWVAKRLIATFYVEAD